MRPSPKPLSGLGLPKFVFQVPSITKPWFDVAQDHAALVRILKGATQNRQRSHAASQHKKPKQPASDMTHHLLKLYQTFQRLLSVYLRAMPGLR